MSALPVSVGGRASCRVELFPEGFSREFSSGVAGLMPNEVKSSAAHS